MIPEADISKLREIQNTISGSDGASIRNRWVFGKYMLGLKKGTQLPKGTLGTLAKDVEVHKSELSARMKFARKFTTELELSDVIRKFSTWHAITRKALIDRPAPTKRQSRSYARVLDLLADFDAETLSPEQARELRKQFQDAIDRIDAISKMRKQAA